MHNSIATVDPLTIVLVHPSRLYTEGLSSLLKDTHYNVIHHAAPIDGASFREGELKGKVLYIVGGRTSLEIVEAVRSIREELPSAYILVINASTGPNDVMVALEAGADGYLRDATSSQTFVRVIELILENETILPPEFVKSLTEPRDASPDALCNGAENSDDASERIQARTGQMDAKVKLSVREGAILRGLVDGEPNKVIAQKLNITEATVKVHVKAILRKIRVKNRTQAAIWATKHLPSTELRRADHQNPMGLQLRW